MSVLDQKELKEQAGLEKARCYVFKTGSLFFYTQEDKFFFYRIAHT
jgi:hypothetical protein